MDFLEQHFETAFSAPGGIKKLRELILTLATQGKLVYCCILEGTYLKAWSLIRTA